MTATEREEKAFMDAIWENPDDDDRRLIFADWLDDNSLQDSDLNNLRAELIRLQVDLAISEPGYSLDMGSPRCHDNSMNPKIKRAIELARRIIYRTSMLGNSYSSGNTIWRRGFVEEIHRIAWYDWWKYGDHLRQWHPVRHVHTDRIRIRRIPNYSKDLVAFELTDPTTYRDSSKLPNTQGLYFMYAQDYRDLSAEEALQKGLEIAVALAEDKWKGTRFHMSDTVSWY